MRTLWPDKVKLFVFLTSYLLMLYFLPIPLEREKLPWLGGLAGGWYVVLSILLMMFRRSYQFVVFGLLLPWAGIGLVAKCPPMLEKLPDRMGGFGEKFVGYHCQFWGQSPSRFLAEGHEYVTSQKFLMLHVAILAGISVLAIILKFRSQRKRG